MNDDEWRSVCFFIDHAWRGEFDESKRKAYRMFLDAFEAKPVLEALRLIAEDGKPFMPTAPEILKAVRDSEEPPVPSWSEAWRAIQKAMSVGGRQYHDPPARKESAAVAWLEAHDLALVARFLEAESYERLSQVRFGDEDYGELRVKELHDRWDEFVSVAKERVRRGHALVAGGRRAVGPVKIDAEALLSMRPRERPQLERGDDRSE